MKKLKIIIVGEPKAGKSIIALEIARLLAHVGSIVIVDDADQDVIEHLAKHSEEILSTLNIEVQTYQAPIGSDLSKVNVYMIEGTAESRELAIEEDLEVLLMYQRNLTKAQSVDIIETMKRGIERVKERLISAGYPADEL